MSLKTLSRVAFGLALAAVVAISLLPVPGLGFMQGNGHDKVAHLVGYCALAMLAALGWPRWRGAILVGLPVFGFAMEVMQGEVGRRFEWADALMNAVGIGIAVALATAVTRWMEREPKAR